MMFGFIISINCPFSPLFDLGRRSRVLDRSSFFRISLFFLGNSFPAQIPFLSLFLALFSLKWADVSIISVFAVN